MISRFPLLLTLLSLAVFAAGCASTGAVPHPFPTPSPHGKTAGSLEDTTEVTESATPNLEPRIPNPAPVDGYIVAGTALQLRGTPYRLGGADPQNGFDCSGLVQYVYAQYGIAVPRDVRSQQRATRQIDDEDIEPGDLLFFATDGRDVSHVAIAISSNQFVHAPSGNGLVRVETLKSDYWAPKYLGARRVIDPHQSTVDSRQSPVNESRAPNPESRH